MQPIGNNVATFLSANWVLGALGLVLALYLGGEFFGAGIASWAALFGRGSVPNRDYRVEDEESGNVQWMSGGEVDRFLTKQGYVDKGVKKGRTHRHVMLDSSGAEVEGSAKDVDHYIPEDWNG